MSRPADSDPARPLGATGAIARARCRRGRRVVASATFPLFPLSVAGLRVDWRVPAETAAAGQRGSRDVARLNPGGSPGWGWVEPWFVYNLGVSTFKFGLALLSGAVVLLLLATAAPRGATSAP